MPRGGARKGAGRFSTWNNRKTKLIRVPEVFADRVVHYARQLDSQSQKSDDKSSLEIVTESRGFPISNRETQKNKAVKNPSTASLQIGLDIETESKVFNLSGIKLAATNGKLVVYLEDLLRVGYKILPTNLEDMLKASIRQR
jgi:hypothetical protein